MTSWFSDPSATRTVALGPDHWFKVRFPLSRAEVQRAVALDGKADEDIAAALVDFIPEWNLTGPSGEVEPITADSIQRLSLGALSALINGLAASVSDSVTVPNGSSAPSPGSSRGSASRTRTSSRKRTT